MSTLPFILDELQVAVDALLIGDATLMGMITGCFDVDSVPSGQALPYITYGSHSDGPWETFQHTNSEATFLLDIWAHSRDDCNAVFAEVKRLLGNGNWKFTLASYSGYLKYEAATILDEPESSDWHLSVRFLSYAHETS